MAYPIPSNQFGNFKDFDYTRAERDVNPNINFAEMGKEPKRLTNEEINSQLHVDHMPKPTPNYPKGGIDTFVRHGEAHIGNERGLPVIGSDMNDANRYFIKANENVFDVDSAVIDFLLKEEQAKAAEAWKMKFASVNRTEDAEFEIVEQLKLPEGNK